MKSADYIIGCFVAALLLCINNHANAQVQVTKGSLHHYSVLPLLAAATYDYHWSVTPGGTSSVFGTSATTNDIIWDGAAGVYTITVYPTKPVTGCAGIEQSLIINVVDMNIVWSSISSVQCPNTDDQPGDFTITAYYTGVSGAWSFNYSMDGAPEQTVNIASGNRADVHIDGFTNPSGTSPVIHTIRISSVTSYDNHTANYTGSESDASSRLHTVTVKPKLSINLGKDTMLCAPDEMVLDAGYSDGFYTWNNGDNNQTIIAREGDGQIWVSVTDANGCIGSDTIQILECSNHFSLSLPNAFTPNGDGYNDYWLIEGYEDYPNVSVKIYDSWGIVVFQSDLGYNQPWDGTSNGKKLPVGAYYYVIDPGNGLKEMVGSITLIR